MTQYKEEKNYLGETFIRRIDADGSEWVIPTSAANSDYQRYLRWLENPDAEEGGTL